MPYRSEAQRRFMHSQKPEIAAKWDKKYGSKVVPKKKRSKAMEALKAQGRKRKD